MIFSQYSIDFLSFSEFTGMQRDVKKGWLHHAYWILYTVATVYSFTITVCFVTVMHDPGKYYSELNL